MVDEFLAVAYFLLDLGVGDDLFSTTVLSYEEDDLIAPFGLIGFALELKVLVIGVENYCVVLLDQFDEIEIFHIDLRERIPAIYTFPSPLVTPRLVSDVAF